MKKVSLLLLVAIGLSIGGYGQDLQIRKRAVFHNESSDVSESEEEEKTLPESKSANDLEKSCIDYPLREVFVNKEKECEWLTYVRLASEFAAYLTNINSLSANYWASVAWTGGIEDCDGRIYKYALPLAYADIYYNDIAWCKIEKEEDGPIKQALKDATADLVTNVTTDFVRSIPQMSGKTLTTVASIEAAILAFALIWNAAGNAKIERAQAQERQRVLDEQKAEEKRKQQDFFTKESKQVLGQLKNNVVSDNEKTSDVSTDNIGVRKSAELEKVEPKELDNSNKECETCPERHQKIY